MTSKKKKTMKKIEDGNKAEGEEDEDYTPWSNAEKDEIFHNAGEIKTFGDEAPIPIGRLKDLLQHINITTPPEFRIKRIPRPTWEEYKAIVEIISGPNVLSWHKGPAFRTTYPDAVADAAWQTITTYSQRYHDELRNTVYHLLPQRKRNQFKVSGVKADVYGSSPGCGCGDEHPSADCPAGDSKTPWPAQRLGCDDQSIPEDGSWGSQRPLRLRHLHVVSHLLMSKCKEWASSEQSLPLWFSYMLGVPLKSVISMLR
jgi:hypothetical protein